MAKRKPVKDKGGAPWAAPKKGGKKRTKKGC